MNTHEYDDAKLLESVERLPRIERDPSVIEAAERQMQQWLREQKGPEKAAPAAGRARRPGTAAGHRPLFDDLSGNRGWGQPNRTAGRQGPWLGGSRPRTPRMRGGAIPHRSSRTGTRGRNHHQLDHGNLRQLDRSGFRYSNAVRVPAQSSDPHDRACGESHLRRPRRTIRLAPRTWSERSHCRPAEVPGPADHGTSASEFRGGP